MIALIFSTLCSLKVFSSGQRNSRCIEAVLKARVVPTFQHRLSLTERGKSSLPFDRINVLTRTGKNEVQLTRS